MKPVKVSFTNSLGKLYNKWFLTIQKNIYNVKQNVSIYNYYVTYKCKKIQIFKCKFNTLFHKKATCCK